MKFLRKFLLGGESWRVGVVNLAVLVCVLRTTAKKVVNVLRKKCTPEKILATPTDETPSYTCSVYNCTAATQGGGVKLPKLCSKSARYSSRTAYTSDILFVGVCTTMLWTSYSAMAPAAIFHLRKWSMPCKMRRWTVLTLSALLLHGPWWQNSFVTLRRLAYYDKFMLFTLDTH